MIKFILTNLATDVVLIYTKMMKYLLILFAIFFLFIAQGPSMAATRTFTATATGTYDWTAANWGGTLPGSADDIIINPAAGAIVTIKSIPASISVTKITIGTSATVGTTGTVVFLATAATIITVSSTSGLICTSNLEIGANITLTTAAALGANVLATSRTIKVLNGGIFIVSGSSYYAISSGTLGTTNKLIINNGGIVRFNRAGAQTIPCTTIDLGGLLILEGSSAGAKTFTSGTSWSVAGTLSIQGQASVGSTSAPNYTSTSTLEFKGSIAQTITGTGLWSNSIASSPYYVIIDNTSGVTSLDNSRPVRGKLVLKNGKFNINGGTLELIGLDNVVIDKVGINSFLDMGINGSLRFGNYQVGTYPSASSFTIPANTFDGDQTFKNLIIERTQKLIFNAQNLLTDNVTLYRGVVELGIGNIVTSAFGHSSGDASSMFVFKPSSGYLGYNFPSGASTSVLFTLGDEVGIVQYTPVTLGFLESSENRMIGLKLFDGIPPNPPSDYLSRYIEIAHPADGSGTYKYDLNLNYMSEDVTGAPANIYPAGWNTGSWSMYPGSADLSGRVVHFTNADQLSGALGNGYAMTGLFVVPVVLPVELITFSAACDEDKEGILLQWSTASEMNTDKFVVESSREMINWNAIHSVSAAGTSSQQRDYAVRDLHSGNGIIYYRLQQFDLNGVLKTYGPISVLCNSNEHIITVYPNPVEDYFNVAISNVEEISVAEIQMTDLTGKIVLSKAVTLNQGKNILSIETIDLLGGTYIVKISGKGISNTLKKMIVM